MTPAGFLRFGAETSDAASARPPTTASRVEGEEDVRPEPVVDGGARPAAVVVELLGCDPDEDPGQRSHRGRHEKELERQPTFPHPVRAVGHHEVPDQGRRAAQGDGAEEDEPRPHDRIIDAGRYSPSSGGGLRLGLAHGIRRRCQVGACGGSAGEEDHLAGLHRGRLLVDGG